MYNQIHLRYNNVGIWEITSASPPTLTFNQSNRIVWYISKHKHQNQQLLLFLLAETKYSKNFKVNIVTPSSIYYLSTSLPTTF